MTTHIAFEKLEPKLLQLRDRFAQAKPFQHVVIDNFLNEESLQELLINMPEPDLRNKSSDYFFAKNKFENPNFSRSGDIFSELGDELIGDRFAFIVSEIYGKLVFVDPKFVGGGIHQGGEGSFLDMHADFSRHPVHSDWLRELNILLYLNANYEESYGGHLELEHAETKTRTRIAPVANRLVIMLTKGHTLHGYKPIKFPAGRHRTSIAAYAYSVNTDFASAPVRSTRWRPEGNNVLKRSFARISPKLVKIKGSIFGSNTARRAEGNDNPKK